MDIREALLTIPTAALSDAQTGMTTMDAGIKTRVPGVKLVGPAFTVRCLTGSIITVHKALAEAQPGDVLVVDGLGDATEALFGELMGRDAKAAGLAGVVIDGPVRDVVGLRELGLPSFSRHVTPRVGSNRRLGTVGARVSCGGITVEPGDWIVGDDDGVVVVPKADADRLVEAGLAIEEKERGIAAKIDAGERIADILNFRALFG